MFEGYDLDGEVDPFLFFASQDETDAILRSLDRFVAIESADVAEVHRSIRSAIANTERLTLILVLVAIFLAIGLGLFISRSISIPNNRLKKVAEDLGKGNLAARATIESGDEIGALAKTFNQMAVALEHADKQQALIDQLDAANEELESFSYSVAHDLRAPLRAIDGFSRLVLEDYGPQVPSETKRYLTVVRENARKMDELIDDILGFARLAREPSKSEPVSPTAVARRVLEGMSADLSGRHVDISIEEMPICQADSKMLREIYVNLLANAVKFTRTRESATIKVGSRLRDGVRFYSVEDNGVGFDMRYADKLFGVFQRLHGVDEYEGTGVGLAIVQRIVHRHGGKVEGIGEVNKGATFYFSLSGEEQHE